MSFKGVYLENINNKLDLNEIVNIIDLGDIKNYVLKTTNTTELSMSEMDKYIECKTSEVAQRLKSEGYVIINYREEGRQYEEEIMDLKKEK